MIRQIQGLALILFGILLLLVSEADLWFPILDDLLSDLGPLCGTAAGVIGLIWVFLPSGKPE